MEVEKVLLTHGSGGRLMRDMIKKVILPAFDNPGLSLLEDTSEIPVIQQGGGSARLVMTTDSYVVKPLFFPGGDIGTLALCGTVNDLATAGAKPLALSAGFIIEEGFPFSGLTKIMQSMRKTADLIPVSFITGDTKVVERGRGDGVYITTTGVGCVLPGIHLSPSRIAPGDVVITSGSVGSHEAAVICARNEFSLGVEVSSDCAPLWSLMERVLTDVPEVKCARDPTRGGLAAVLTEFVESSGFGIAIDEEAVPVEESVRNICEILGFDPLFMANEGKMVLIVPEENAQACLEAMQTVPEGKECRIIGKVHAGKPRLTIRTRYGTSRLLTLPAGNQLPRIC